MLVFDLPSDSPAGYQSTCASSAVDSRPSSSASWRLREADSLLRASASACAAASAAAVALMRSAAA